VVPPEGIKNRALMMGITTGDMPDVDFIWSVQKSEGKDVCFGQGLNCLSKNCHWYKKCRALDFFADVSFPVRPPSNHEERIQPLSASAKNDNTDNLFVGRVKTQAGKLEVVI